MRPAVLGAYAEMLPRLEAERSLSSIQDLAAGSGSLEKDALKEHLGELRRVARIRRKAKPARTSDLEALGITVERS